VTSPVGSADLLAALGCRPAATVAEDTAAYVFRRMPFAFAHASRFHPRLERVLSLASALGFRTIFNDIGPLLNPARPSGFVLGVADPTLGRPFAEVLARDGVVRAMVVCGDEGLDEISCAGSTRVWEVMEGGTIREIALHPTRDFGLEVYALECVRGSNAEENARTLERLLTGRAARSDAALVDFVLMNAAAVLVVAGLASDLRDGVRMARESMQSGKAWVALETLKEDHLDVDVDR
jgi:anthranilate phosphoribosyltransferase